MKRNAVLALTLGGSWLVAYADQAGAQPVCTAQNTVFAHVVALDQVIASNRLGASMPGGMVFALARDVCTPSSGGSAVCDSTRPPSAGAVMLKPYKRPRPMTLRVNQGQCLRIGFTNLLSASANGPQPVTRSASVHVQGLSIVNTPDCGPYTQGPMCNDGSWVGNNPSGLVPPAPRPLNLAVPQINYTLYAGQEGAFLLYSASDVFSNNGGSGDGGQLAMGLFGAVHVEPFAAEWYRSQVTAADLDAATQVDAGGGKKISPYGQPLINYFANYKTTIQDPCFQQGTCRVGPVLFMVCPVRNDAYLCQAREIVHSDLTAVITGPKAGRFPTSLPESPTMQSSYSLPDRLQPFREFTIVYHEMFNVAQAFPAYYAASGTAVGNGEGQDQFAINYGMGGIGSEVVANRLNVGPMANCTTCKFEEFFLTSWAVGDPAMIVDNPTSGQCTAPGTCLDQSACDANQAGQCSNFKCQGNGLCSDNTTKCQSDSQCQVCNWSQTFSCKSVPPTKAFFPDDPSNVYHSYISDHTKFRILHGGSDLHHVHHQHAHQWLHSPDTSNGDYLDSQSIGPGSSFSLEMTYNSSGNVNQTVGDSIFHCHFYPHFAGGMWSLWRVHDVYETGTLLAPDGTARAGINRALPDGEIFTGTPIPGLVPLPTIPMPPMPGKVRLADKGTTVQVCDDLGQNCVPALSPTPPGPVVLKNPGFPFFIPGIGGQRAPHPPLDFAKADDGSPLDGGLPRHLIRKCAYPPGPQGCAETPPLSSFLDFSKTLKSVDAFQLPETGTFVEGLAMTFHEQRFVKSMTPEGCNITINGYNPPPTNPPGCPPGGLSTTRPANFILNGLRRVAGAPFADPCIAYTLNGGPPPWHSMRRYKAADIQLDAVFNKEGWHFPQQRMLSLWGDVKDYLSGSRPPEPFFFRANSGECIEYVLANLVPNVYELDDFQVRTPTDIIGQHIHLVKFDVTSSDGATNGFNYEDGTLAPNEVMERIGAINAAGGLWPDYTSRGVQKRLAAKPIPFFGTGPGGQWMGAQATVQRWYTDRLYDGTVQKPGVDRTLRTVFTHDHFGPSTHQQAGLYAGLVIEPEGSQWFHNEARAADPPFGGQGVTPRDDGGPTTWQAVIVPTKAPASSFREFLLEFQDTTLTYAPFTFKPPAPGAFCSNTGAPCTPATATQPSAGCSAGGVCFAYGFCSQAFTQKCTPDPVANYVCGPCRTDGKCTQNPQLTCGGANPVIASCAEGATCNLVAGVPGGAVAANTTGWGTGPFDAGGQVELITLANGTNSFSVNYRSEPLFPRVNTPALYPSNDLSFAYASIDRGGLRKMCKGSNNYTCVADSQCVATCNLAQGSPGTCTLGGASCTSNQQCPNFAPCVTAGFCSDTNAFCVPGIASPCANPAATCNAFPYAKSPLTKDVDAKDPFTPILRAYAGDDVQVRTLVGAHINPHNFTMHGLSWLVEPSFVDSGWRNSEVMGISEHFEEIVRVPAVKGVTSATDYIYMAGAAALEQAGGNWGLMRAYGATRPQDDLKRLPQNTGATAPICPANLPPGQPPPYKVVALTASQAFAGKSIVYNTRGPMADPNAILYFRLEDLTCPAPSQSCKARSQDAQPLVLRARAGDCMQVILYNAIPGALVTSGATSALPPPSGYPSNTSTSVGLHPQLVTFDVRTSNGFNAGFNPVQTVAPLTGLAPVCQPDPQSQVNCITYTWYAGNIDVRAPAGAQHIPIEFGAANLLPSDPINHHQYGLFGALVIEPPGATCATSGPMQPLQNCRAPLARIHSPSTGFFREQVLITRDGLQGPCTPPGPGCQPPTLQPAWLVGDGLNTLNYRAEPLFVPGSPWRVCGSPAGTDFSCVLSSPKALCCSAWDATTSACTAAGPCGDPQTPILEACPGEQVRLRILHAGGINTNQVFELYGHVWQEQPYMSSGKGCAKPSPTTQTNLYASSAIGTSNGCGVLEQDSFSEYQGSRMGHGPTNHFDVLIPSAGGPWKVPGDYLYRTYPADHFRLGLWGIFRVTPNACGGPRDAPGAATSAGGGSR